MTQKLYANAKFKIFSLALFPSLLSYSIILLYIYITIYHFILPPTTTSLVFSIFYITYFSIKCFLHILLVKPTLLSHSILFYLKPILLEFPTYFRNLILSNITIFLPHISSIAVL